MKRRGIVSEWEPGLTLQDFLQILSRLAEKITYEPASSNDNDEVITYVYDAENLNACFWSKVTGSVAVSNILNTAADAILDTTSTKMTD